MKAIVCACGAAVTWNVFVTGAAAAYDAFPACDAVIEHVPVVRSVTLVTETVQTLVLFEAKPTVKPLDAVAESTTGPWSTRVSAGCANVIVCACGAAVTWNVFVTGVAAAYVALPACDAVIEHVPALTSVTDEPETVQTEALFDANDTDSPLDAVAESATGP